jgi:hypothetical protein
MNKNWGNIIRDSIKTGVNVGFAISYWFVFGLFILFGWVMKGAGLGITLAILFGIGYWFIVNMFKMMMKKARKDQMQI